VPPYGLDEDRFWNASPAAADIFKYRREHPELKDAVWGFDKGNVDEGGRSNYAWFSRTALSGWGKDKLVISAIQQANGSWKLAHTITLA
jgi:hypothetical protein